VELNTDTGLNRLFVYGSLLSRSTSAAGSTPRRALRQGGKLVGEACIQGRLFDFVRYPGLVASKGADEIVHGELWELRDPGQLLPRLDRYEGIGPHIAKPHEFERRQADVVREPSERVLAWAYFYNLSITGRRLIADGRWLK
jgi:gamma-glutamylcyclotransferase (GGCT)/AIG2-like uncharacterized protein YtfP